MTCATADYDLDTAHYLYPNADSDLHPNWIIDFHNVYRFFSKWFRLSMVAFLKTQVKL